MLPKVIGFRPTPRLRAQAEALAERHGLKIGDVARRGVEALLRDESLLTRDAQTLTPQEDTKAANDGPRVEYDE